MTNAIGGRNTMVTILQILALIALIYDGLVALAVLGWLAKCIIQDWRF